MSTRIGRIIMARIMAIIVSICVLSSASQAGDIWRADLNKLITTSTVAEQDSLIGKIAAAKPDWQQIQTALRSLTFTPVETGKFILDKTTCIDNIERPYVVYIPNSYDPNAPIPLVVYLHGSISRTNLIDNPIEWAGKNAFSEFAEQQGYILLFPFGQAGATWWDDVGISNILNLVRVAKHKYNIDDNRVFLGGFSDGGSAAYLFAMAFPNDFAGFVALNGHMGVGNQDGGLPTYAPNFANSQVYAVSTDKDQLYPTSEIQRFIAMAKSAGANILYRQLVGEHSFAYADSEFPHIAEWMHSQIRNPFPSKIIWEAALPNLGVCHWFAIDEITADDPAGWYQDYNAAYADSSIAIGIVPDDIFAGTGVKVAGIADGDYLARRIGLQAGDILTKAGNTIINGSDDLATFKKTLRRGDLVTLLIKRDNSDLILRGRMPIMKNYFLFKREQPSAVARVSYAANRVEIEASRLGAFKIFVSPQMFDLEKNIVVVVNGVEVYNSPVAPDISYMLCDFTQNRDRHVLYLNEIAIKLK
jgi:predicted esterase